MFAGTTKENLTTMLLFGAIPDANRSVPISWINMVTGIAVKQDCQFLPISLYLKYYGLLIMFQKSNRQSKIITSDLEPSIPGCSTI